MDERFEGTVGVVDTERATELVASLNSRFSAINAREFTSEQ